MAFHLLTTTLIFTEIYNTDIYWPQSQYSRMDIDIKIQISASTQMLLWAGLLRHRVKTQDTINIWCTFCEREYFSIYVQCLSNTFLYYVLNNICVIFVQYICNIFECMGERWSDFEWFSIRGQSVRWGQPSASLMQTTAIWLFAFIASTPMYSLLTFVQLLALIFGWSRCIKT